MLARYPWLRKKIISSLSDSYWLETYASVIQAAQRPDAYNLLYDQLKPGVLPPLICQCFERANSAILAYGQEGEDIVLRHLLPKEKGFFVDVGAHHPVRFSNTWTLYQRGWRGINIDATPGSMKLFNALRPEDTNIEALVSDTSGPVTFFSFEEPALNTLDMRLAKSYIDANWPLKERIELVPQTLSALLDAHVPAGTHIDIMSIDVEEYELNVFKTNNWNVYKPTILIVEILTASLRTLDVHPVVEYLQKHGYVPVAKLCRSVFFIQE